MSCDNRTSIRRAGGPEAARMGAVTRHWATVRGSEKWQPCFLTLKHTTVIGCGHLSGAITRNLRITEFMMETKG